MPVPKIFNTTAVCFPDKHYMVDLTDAMLRLRLRLTMKNILQ